MKKMIYKLGAYCSENSDVCKKYAGVVFTYDNEEEFLKSKARKFFPPNHNRCDCKMEELLDGKEKMEQRNETRKRIEKASIKGEIETMVIVVKPKGSEEAIQVALTEQEQMKILKYLLFLHNGAINCYMEPIGNINIVKVDIKPPPNTDFN